MVSKGIYSTLFSQIRLWVQSPGKAGAENAYTKNLSY